MSRSTTESRSRAIQQISEANQESSEALRRLTNAIMLAAVVVKALAVYSIVENQREKGGVLIVSGEDNRVRAVISL